MAQFMYKFWQRFICYCATTGIVAQNTKLVIVKQLFTGKSAIVEKDFDAEGTICQKGPASTSKTVKKIAMNLVTRLLRSVIELICCRTWQSDATPRSSIMHASFSWSISQGVMALHYQTANLD